jgi:hypothetical protein
VALGSSSRRTISEGHGSSRELMATKAELRRLCKKWQRILRLEDWDIAVRYGDSHHTNDELASVSCHSHNKSALVTILKPEARPDNVWWIEAFPDQSYDDEENHIVHELLHVRFDKLIEDSQEGSPHDVLHEQAIEALVQALLKLDRQGRDEN